MRRESVSGRLCMGSIATVLWVGTAWSNPEADASKDPLPPSVRACASLNNDSERLACYDRAVANLPAGATAESATTSAEEMFGMTRDVARNKNTLVPAKREELTEINAKVTNVRELGDGTALLTLDSGQVWQLMEKTRAQRIQDGDSVKISRGALGSFRLIGPGKRAVRVRRVR